MSQILQQKIGSLQAAEQKIATSLQSVSKVAQDQQLKEKVQNLINDTLERVTKLGMAIGALKMQATPTSNPATDGIVKELEQYSQAQPSADTDINIINSLQKLISTLATDYSFTANIAYQNKQEGQAIKSLSEAFEKLKKANEELVSVAQQLLSKLSQNSSTQSGSQSMVDKIKQTVSSAQQAVAA